MNMKLRYRLFLRRKSVYYAFDDTTKTFTSLKTKDKAEANRLLMAMNEAGKQPAMNLSLARVYLRHSDPLVTTRTWRGDSKNYHRLESSLNRWMGVTLYYQKAWWNKTGQCWVDEKFHVLDNVWLCHRGEPPPDTGLCEVDALTSAFVWNEVIFRSFRAGNLKSIDFEFYKSLESAVAKRLYRFLDKRFYHRDRCEFQLRELACQHLGMSANYDVSNLKRKMLPGVRELEARGFLEVSSDELRFRKVRAGDWSVTFEKGRCVPLPSSGSEVPQTKLNLAAALTDRGVSANVAATIIAQHTADSIEAKLRVFDWLAARLDAKMLRNPAGFLVSSIREGYEPPRGFLDRKQNTQRPVTTAIRKRLVPKQRTGATLEKGEELARQAAIANFWQTLPEPERCRSEAEAIEAATDIERGVIERGKSFAKPTRQALLDAYALKRISATK